MPDTMLLFQIPVLLLAIGSFADVLAGILGVGGNTALIPAFAYVSETFWYNASQFAQACLAASLITMSAVIGFLLVSISFAARSAVIFEMVNMVSSNMQRKVFA